MKYYRMLKYSLSGVSTAMPRLHGADLLPDNPMVKKFLDYSIWRSLIVVL